MDQHTHDHGAGSDPAPQDSPGGHGMAVVGTKTLFFSHLPMFMSPHDYQVILEGTVSLAGSDPQRAYQDDRAKHPEATLYTFSPASFVLTELFPPAPRRTQFRGDLFRGHFEMVPEFPTQRVPIATGAHVDVTNVVYAKKLTPHVKHPETLEYLLFGKGSEQFLAHIVTGPPDFDHLVSATVSGRQFTDNELRGGVRVQVTGVSHSAAHRLKPGKTVAATADVAGQKVAIKLEPRAELYFMERELADADE